VPGDTTVRFFVLVLFDGVRSAEPSTSSGTLIEVGLGRREPTQISAALLSGRRADAGRTAFPEGLYLVEVRYPEATVEVPDGPDTSSEAPGGEDEED
jgi:hypothetical protein